MLKQCAKFFENKYVVESNKTDFSAVKILGWFALQTVFLDCSLTADRAGKPNWKLAGN